MCVARALRISCIYVLAAGTVSAQAPSCPPTPGSQPEQPWVHLTTVKGGRYYRQSSITIEADGQGLAVTIPHGLGTRDTIQWRRTFQVSPAQRAEVNRLFDGNGLFTRTWHEVPPPPGAPSAMLIVTRGGCQVTVPRAVVADQSGFAEAMIAAVQGLLPPLVQADLESAWQDFQASSPRQP